MGLGVFWGTPASVLRSRKVTRIETFWNPPLTAAGFSRRRERQHQPRTYSSRVRASDNEEERGESCTEHTRVYAAKLTPEEKKQAQRVREKWAKPLAEMEAAEKKRAPKNPSAVPSPSKS